MNSAVRVPRVLTGTYSVLVGFFNFMPKGVVKSAEKIRLEEEQRQLQESNDLLASDSDILLQSSNSRTGVARESLRFTTFMNSAVRVPRVLTGTYSYVVKSAEKIRLEEEQRQLQESNDLLASDSDILLPIQELV
jgi:transposase-like protein